MIKHKIVIIIDFCFNLGTTHSFAEDEKLAFVDWINFQLENDPDLASLLPVSEEGEALFRAVHDGLILW